MTYPHGSIPVVSSVQVPASPLVGTCSGYDRLDGVGATPLAGPAGVTINDRALKCWFGDVRPGSCTSYVPVMIAPTGNLPHATAGNGLPLSVAPVMVSGGFASICACVAPGPAGPDGRVLSTRTRTVWRPGNSIGT